MQVLKKLVSDFSATDADYFASHCQLSYKTIGESGLKKLFSFSEPPGDCSFDWGIFVQIHIYRKNFDRKITFPREWVWEGNVSAAASNFNNRSRSSFWGNMFRILELAT